MAAATIQRTHAGAVSYEETAVYSASQAMFVARPIAIGADTINLILYGTGFDSVTAASAVTIATLYTANGALTGGATLAATSVGPVGTVPGIDQDHDPDPGLLRRHGLGGVYAGHRRADGESGNGEIPIGRREEVSRRVSLAAG